MIFVWKIEGPFSDLKPKRNKNQRSILIALVSSSFFNKTLRSNW